MKEQPNLSYINQLSGGDKEFETKLISIVKKELPEEIYTYNLNLKNKNFELAADNVHKLKHKISILGLELCYQLAIDYEDDLREQNLSRKNEFENVLQAMINFIEELK
ncbi:Hpt domain-containing protein [Mesonia sp.]|uniref:Hpt domain-containing protein n=1 Tax=Mesonia sp. TaxID=1960830 RepID=UPI001770680B|nr:Hpt domain-containing protein [Mesonia sp.]HIB38130.1 Hpt domain-containing protein [Mesonia sp.]